MRSACVRCGVDVAPGKSPWTEVVPFGHLYCAACLDVRKAERDAAIARGEIFGGVIGASQEERVPREIETLGEGDTMSYVENLRQRGFDLSYAIPFERAWKIRCSQCKAVCVNGVPCHETGCINEQAEQRV